eukprot:Amastigsp_a1738_39.p3 type:complete len:221 gc:universal Amastigsp_a1738_39:860-198(-)
MIGASVCKWFATLRPRARTLRGRSSPRSRCSLRLRRRSSAGDSSALTTSSRRGSRWSASFGQRSRACRWTPSASGWRPRSRTRCGTRSSSRRRSTRGRCARCSTLWTTQGQGDGLRTARCCCATKSRTFGARRPWGLSARARARTEPKTLLWLRSSRRAFAFWLQAWPSSSLSFRSTTTSSSCACALLRAPMRQPALWAPAQEQALWARLLPKRLRWRRP